ncbi:MAG: tRNA epoxyqueuosine(34) reductase QueG [Bacteroidia bacterium]|nr:tRNA epoxyqueuosine(34) reductase QueG [Bacteroidia bacterium]
MSDNSLDFDIESHIKSKAQELGFLACGFTQERTLNEHESTLQDWLLKDYHGEMSYMERNLEMRLNPQLLEPGCKTVISLAYNYFPSEKHSDDALKIAKYAWGEDYHYVVKDKCKDLLKYIQELDPNATGRCFVDSAPIMERQWAQLAGIGWIGKNSLVLRKGTGSFFFLAEILVNIELKSDKPVTDHCGSCTACIDACPTQAIVQEGVIDSNKCISYLTIEKKSPLTSQEQDWRKDWLFGCDICQDVCPWNRFSEPHNEPRFEPTFSSINRTKEEWQNADATKLKSEFKKSPLIRSKPWLGIPK